MIDRLQPFVPQRVQQSVRTREQLDPFDLNIGPVVDRTFDRFEGRRIAQDAIIEDQPSQGYSRDYKADLIKEVNRMWIEANGFHWLGKEAVESLIRNWDDFLVEILKSVRFEYTKKADNLSAYHTFYRVI